MPTLIISIKMYQCGRVVCVCMCVWTTSLKECDSGVLPSNATFGVQKIIKFELNVTKTPAQKWSIRNMHTKLKLYCVYTAEITSYNLIDFFQRLR